MIERYIGIWKQGEMFRTYSREGEEQSWKRVKLEAEDETRWSDQSFEEIFRNRQIDAESSTLGMLVISDKEEVIDFPAAAKTAPFSAQDLRDFCRSYAKKGAAHWALNGETLDDGLCEKLGFPMDPDAGSQYILTNAAVEDSFEDLLAAESVIPEETPEEPEEAEAAPAEEVEEAEAGQAEEAEETPPPPPVPLSEKQRRQQAYINDILSGDRPDPLKKW